MWFLRRAVDEAKVYVIEMGCGGSISHAESFIHGQEGTWQLPKGGKALFREYYLFSKWLYMPGSQFLIYNVPINLAPGLPSLSLPWFFPFTLTLTLHSPFLLFPLSEESIRPGDHTRGLEMGEEWVNSVISSGNSLHMKSPNFKG